LRSHLHAYAPFVLPPLEEEAPRPLQDFGSNADRIAAMAYGSPEHEPDQELDEDSFDSFEEDLSDDEDEDEDEDEAPTGYEPRGEAHPRPENRKYIRKAGVSASGLRVSGLGHEMFADETRSANRFRSIGDWTGHHNGSLRPGEEPVQFDHYFTHYLDDQEMADTELFSDTGEDGVARLLQRSGARLDTQAASGIGTQAIAQADGRQRMGERRYIYTMDERGDMRALDPWASRVVRERGGDNPGHELGFVNHSSLVQGGLVAAAGDIEAKDGRVTGLTNGSGHYMPDPGMLHQAAEALAISGVMDIASPTPASMQILFGGPDAPATTDALTFLAASQGQSEIASSAFGSSKAAAKTQQTASRKAELMDELMGRGAGTRSRA
jgi:hypothetical protein